MAVRGTTSRSWARGVTALGWVAFAVLIGHGCVTTQTTEPQTPGPQPPGSGEVPPRPDDPTLGPDELKLLKDCASRQAMERFIVDTTVAVAVAYGRIDPFLYVVTPTREIGIDPSAPPLDAEAAKKAGDLLEQINRDRLARALLTKNIGRAQKLCKDRGCPQQVVYRLRADEGNSELKQAFSLTGPALPSDAEREAFLTLSDLGKADCERGVVMTFEGAKLVILRIDDPCSRIKDCHPAGDVHQNSKCCSEYTAVGEWKDRDSPFGRQHCCD